MYHDTRKKAFEEHLEGEHKGEDVIGLWTNEKDFKSWWKREKDAIRARPAAPTARSSPSSIVTPPGQVFSPAMALEQQFQQQMQQQFQHQLQRQDSMPVNPQVSMSQPAMSQPAITQPGLMGSRYDPCLDPSHSWFGPFTNMAGLPMEQSPYHAMHP